MKKSLASLVFIPTEEKAYSEGWFTFLRIQGSLTFRLFSVVSTAWCPGVWHHLKTHVWSDLLVIFTAWQVKEFWLLRMVIPQAVPSAAWVSYHSIQFSRSVMSDSVTPWMAACQTSLSITDSRNLLKLMSIKSVMPCNHLCNHLCRPLLFPPSIFHSTRVFSNESVLRIRWPKFWSFSFSISPSNEYSGLISFRMDRLDLFAVQRTL